MTGPSNAVVLVVEDDPDLRDLLRSWLEPLYDVRTAADGEAALDAITAEVDVVLLDRHLPGMSGDEVLEAIRDRGIDCQVSMLTAIEPTLDIVEMDFEEYLVKPVSQQELLRTVDSLLARAEYSALMNRYFELTAKLGVLERSEDATDLEGSDDYRQLKAEHERVAAELSRQQTQLVERGEFEKLFVDLEAP